MRASEFYKQKTNHDLKENRGVRLTGKELFDLMEQYASQSNGYPDKCKGCETSINNSYYCADCNRKWDS